MFIVNWLAGMAVHIKGQPHDEQNFLIIAAATSANKARRGCKPVSYYMNILFMMLADLDLYICLRGAPALQ